MRMARTALVFACSTMIFLMTTIFTVKGGPCNDDPLWAKACLKLKKNFGDRICISQYTRKIARFKCRGTCGFCSQGSKNRAQAPPIRCSRTRYGCCWDRVTAARGPRDKGCPPCLDRHHAICRRFRWMCPRNTANADYIKFNCPVRCGLCHPHTYISTGKEESLNSILSRIRLKEYLRSKKSRKG